MTLFQKKQILQTKLVEQGTRELILKRKNSNRLVLQQKDLPDLGDLSGKGGAEPGEVVGAGATSKLVTDVHFCGLL